MITYILIIPTLVGNRDTIVRKKKNNRRKTWKACRNYTVIFKINRTEYRSYNE